jgi:Na+/proline symporter/signal transduction histidine kinase
MAEGTMLGFLFVALTAVCYLGLLFAVAWLGDRCGAHLRKGAWEPMVYALSLAVYCTSWSLYGSIGHAAWSGLGFTLIYIGAVLMLLLGYPLMQKMIRVSQANNVTSVADFIGARYGKSQRVAALVTIIAVVGIVPFISLQLQAVSFTFDMLIAGKPGSASAARSTPLWQDTAFYVALTMAVFAMLFGLRHVHTNERHQGMMVAIAFESLVKLGTFVALGLFAIFVLFSGPGDLAERLAENPAITDKLTSANVRPHWITIALLAALAFICLPRQFHVTVVENSAPGNLRTAAWVFPLYLIGLSAFVPVIAAAGMLTFDQDTFPEFFPLLLPLTSGYPIVALAVFIGGLSAATAMIIVEVVALSTMVCNELVMPLMLRQTALRESQGPGMGALLLRTRRFAVLGILLAAYAYHSATADRYYLSSIGIISFAAVAQFAPALIAGLYWRGAHRYGAFAGMAGGALIWTCSMLLPSLPESALRGFLSVLSSGSLPPLYPDVDPLTNSIGWSLLVNTTLLIGISLLARSNERDRLQANTFVGGPEQAEVQRSQEPAHAATFVELKRLAERLVGPERAARAFSGSVETYRDQDLAVYTERLLSGAIGAASAHIMVTAVMQRHRTHLGGTGAILEEASEAILFNHDLLRATFENVTQGIGMFDAQWRLAAWNRRLLELLNVSEDQVQIGTPLQLLLGDRERLGCDLPSLLLECADPQQRATARTRQQRLPDGRVLEFQVNPIQAGGFVLVCTDVTEQIRTLEALRESERRIREANESLEQRVAERTRELTLLNEQLAEAKRVAEAANVGKTRFLAAASHDLLQPLHVARILTGALSERQRTGKPSILLAQLDQALGAVDELLQTLLDISKLDTGVLQPQLQPVEIQKVLTGLIASFQPMAAQRGLLLTVVPSRAVVYTDPALLRRILQNFVSNALRYTRRGKVLVGCRRRAGRIVVEVWDTGVGIPQDELKVIFEEFRRGGSNDSETPPGLGLGLAIVDRIARMLEHPVSVRSWPGRGSVFSVSVPMSRSAPATVLPGADERSRGSLARRLVLCVDNDPTVLVAMRTLLQGWSCEVITARDVLSACHEIDQRGAVPDIVLMDYHLEGDVTGLEALGTLAAHLGRHVPAIIITANYTEAVRQAADTLGYRILNKPVRPGALRALMAQMLSRETPEPVRSATVV